MNVCIPNIGPRQRRRRLAFGVLALGFTLTLAAVLTLNDAPALVRGSVIFPLYASLLGFLQYRERT